MKDSSASLDMRRYKNWAHKISSWEYLSADLSCQFFPWAQGASFLLPTLNSFMGCWRSAAAAAHDLILAEVDGKYPCQVPICCCYCSVVISDFLWPHEMQHARLPSSSLSPGVCSNSYPLSQWSHLTISYSVAPFSCPRSFPGSGSFPMSQLFSSGDQSIEASASASVPPGNIRGWFPLGLTGLISLLSNRFSRVFSNGLSRVFSSTTIQRHQFFGAQPPFRSNSVHDY